MISLFSLIFLMFLVSCDSISNEENSCISGNQGGNQGRDQEESDCAYRSIKRCSDDCPEIEMILIEGGSFNMGSNISVDEQPIHQVQIIHNFYVGKTEVTVGQYRACINAGVCTSPTTEDCNWTSSIGNKETHPMNCVDWYQARTFAKWIGGDLLSEAQWEYVATSEGKAITYPWGNTEPTCQLVNFNNDGYCVNPPNGSTTPVCSMTDGNTMQGVCDMGGNVYEWVLDEWHSSYTDAPTNEQAWCNDIGICNTNLSAFRVFRGGAWSDIALFLRSADRGYNAPDLNLYDVGFRVTIPLTN